MCALRPTELEACDSINNIGPKGLRAAPFNPNSNHLL